MQYNWTLQLLLVRALQDVATLLPALQDAAIVIASATADAT